MNRAPGSEKRTAIVAIRRVRDRIDRDYAQPLDVEALARDAHMSAFRRASTSAPAAPRPPAFRPATRSRQRDRSEIEKPRGRARRRLNA
ncbi:hypothetical protein ACFSWE_02560 [Leucobacter albus]|uniref:Uncharacterized protein n=1 Tax=Leucobacter albus TaxID=272210 RepID=A0ABW3TRV6_9MICO